MTNLYDAHRQWAVRPPDERFDSLESLYQAVNSRRHASHEQVRTVKEIDIKTLGEGSLAINGATPPAMLTNWSFGQLCSMTGAPARYLRTLPPELVTLCVRHALGKAESECRLLLRQPDGGNGIDHLVCSALTGPGYGRIWDASVVEYLMEAVDGTAWRVPPALPVSGSQSAGLYASDRDMFAFMVNPEDVIEVGNAKLGRGFFCWNSETGAATFGLTTFLYNYVCGNHVVWGAEEVSELKIVHRHKAPERFIREALPTLNRFVESNPGAHRIREVIARAMDSKVGDTLEDVQARLGTDQFTKKELSDAWETGIAEHEDVTTLWGMVQGLTAIARLRDHADQRVSLERRAGTLLS